MPGRLIPGCRAPAAGTCDLPEIVAVVCVTAWLLSVGSTYTWRGAEHMLLAVAAVSTGLHFYRSRRTPTDDGKARAKDCH